MEYGDAERSDTNENICNSSPSPDRIPASKGNITSLENSLTSCVNSTTPADGATATTSQDMPQYIIDFIVIYNKQKININFRIDGTVSELKNYLQNIIAVPQAMQKVMFKGLAKDNQTLRSLGVVKGSKVMIVGSKLDDVLAVSIPTKHDIADDSASAASKEPLSQQTIHRKVLDKGVPEDAMPGILDTKETGNHGLNLKEEIQRKHHTV
ncbi:ubiquitin domain-containing protein UBFD1-like isoform X2 [Belonocnema kinseyi]|uniref:ubiquitin domain-containing protein UBFD1-like isoform X2 n=1 Tax=Belonocnema kinseyi TaxID=2817044 RepID=UPI00143CD257|nr:ubiquitin domain-containing protein UBFD1-like isoform X2 [Belonocnema kinseyi]